MGLRTPSDAMLEEELVTGTRPGTNEGSTRPAAPERTKLEKPERKRREAFKKRNLRDALVAVDNPHRRCSAWLGRVIMGSESESREYK